MKKLIANLSIIFAIGGFSQLPVSADGLSDGEIQATIALEPNEQGQREASLTFAASEYERTVTLVYGDEDAGARVECWPHRVVLGKVQPGSTSATFALPQEVGTSFGLVRFVFTTTGLSSSAYVQDGLVIQYDALENAGRGSYDPTIDKWKNLAAAGVNDIRVRSTGSYTCTFEGTHLSIPSKTVLGVTLADAALLPRDSAKSVESIYWIDDGSITDTTGSRAYPVNVCEDAMFTTRGKENTFTCATFVDVDGNAANMLGTDLTRNNQAFLAQPQSYSLVNMPDSSKSTMRINGEAYIEGNVTAGNSHNFYKETREHTAKIQIGNSRGTMKVSTVRIYNRALMDEERAQNYEVDRLRFFGAATPVIAVPIAFTATVDRRAATADFLFTATNLVRRLCVAWGNRDCGAAATNAWPNVADIAEVPAMAFKAEGVALPNEVFEARGYRFFLVDVYDSTSYVSEGLKVQWDAIENAGRGSYDPTIDKWKNLAAAGVNDIKVRLTDSYTCTFEGTHLSIPSTTVLSVRTDESFFPRSDAKTVESVYWIDDGSITDTTGSRAYPVNVCGDAMFTTRGMENTFTCATFVDVNGNADNMSGTDLTRNNQAFLAQPQSYSLVNMPDSSKSTMRINGEAYIEGNVTAGHSQNFYKDKEPREHTAKILVGNSKGTMKVSTVRIYDRALTDAERDLNALVDRVRYCGDPAPVQASDYLRNSSGLVLLFR